MPLASADAERLHGLAHLLLAADQDRRAVAVVAEHHGGADGALLLALGEDDALRVGLAPARTGSAASGWSDRAGRDSARRYSAMSGIGRRATPESIAACATADDTAEIRRGSNGFGMMYSGP